VAKNSHAGANWADDRLMSHMLRSRRSALSLAVAVALGLPAVGQAQTAPAAAAEPELEEVVVTGIRAGITDAIQIKADMQSITETISAEDIGKLPDTSIADSIARLPGVTTQRAEGRASLISIRGTDPGFAVGLMNGREQVSTGDNRAIEYDQYPSELINAVVVYKTPDSQLFAQGLSGTIDLQTIRPLDYGKQALVLNLRYEQNSQGNLGAGSSDTGYRASFSYIDQFMDGKLGVAVGFARLDSPLATKSFGTYEPWHVNGTQAANRNPGVPADAYVTDGMKVRTDMGTNTRDGYLATIEYRPSASFGSILDLYYTDASQVNNVRSLEVNLSGYPAPCCDAGPFPPGTVFGYSNPTIRGNTVVAGDINTLVPLVRNFRFTTDDTIFAGGWLNQIQLNDEWGLRADLGYSKATRDQLQFETNGTPEWLTPRPPGGGNPHWPTVDGTFSLNPGKMAQLTFDGGDFTNPANIKVGPTIYGAGYAKKPHVEDSLWSGSLIARRDGELWWFGSTSFGANYTDRKKEKESPETGLSTINNGWYEIDSKYLLSPTNLNYAKAGKVLAWQVGNVVSEYFNPVVWGTPETLSYLAGKWWNVDEKVWTGFVRGDLDHVLSDSVTLKGNVGLQVVYTDQSSGSFEVRSNSGQVSPVSGGKSYTDVLPQLNLVFELPDEQAVRFAFSRQLARARMDQLKASTEYGFDNGTGKPGGASGNPELDPWLAWAYDLSYEKYFAGYEGYASAAVFYKDLESYIYSVTDTNYNFCDNSLNPPPNLPVPPLCIGNFTQPQNGDGGYLFGVELAFSVPFSLMTEALDGFGLAMSYAYTDSDIEIEDQPFNGSGILPGNSLGSIPLPGLSENVWNGTLYYEKYGFAARFAARYRSKYIGEVTNFANERALKYVDGGTFMDAQLSYAFDEGMLDGLMLLFQINNLANEPYYAYAVDERRYQDFQEYGTTYLIGATYRFGGQ
jgi:TonB-dependent receptor